MVKKIDENDIQAAASGLEAKRISIFSEQITVHYSRCQDDAKRGEQARSHAQRHGIVAKDPYQVIPYLLHRQLCDLE